MSTNRKDIFKTRIICLKDIADYSFSIPTYQRPYVWGDEQLKKIIDDFYKAFKSNKSYYIGIILTKEDNYNAELIDGQQRFTTLWLLAFVITQLSPKCEISKFLKNKENKLRFSFEIRDEIKDYLNSLLKINDKIFDDEDIKQYPYLKNIAKALTFIKGYIEQLFKNTTDEEKIENLENTTNEIEKFGNFIFTNVKMIKNTTPSETDLNKLFSTINNSGVQLEQTDIIKANLLKVIAEEKVLYSKIWETCENMNNFFERNARTSFPESDWKNIDLTQNFEFSPTIFKYKSTGKKIEDDKNNFKIEEFTIDQIEDYPFNKKNSVNEDERKSEEVYCRSIINFGQLLLHTYRIHLKIEKKEDFEGTFHINRLIEIFKVLEKRNNSEEVKRFFKLLWSVRYLFDKYVVKWVSDTSTKNEALELMNFSKNNDSYYPRTPFEKTNTLMLQSVLYFTGDYLRQYWLTSYLDYLYYNYNNESPKSENHLKYLEHIDNVFSLTKKTTDRELSWEMMHQTSDFVYDFNIEEYLKKNYGTGFKHYWFYKLEYILWKNWENRDDEKFKKYRISSKNSVEHIFPQNEEFGNKLIVENILNSFGNLVLLSVSQNSAYSNQSPEKKKIDFKKKENYDSLKSYYIFNSDNENWNEKTINNHNNEMIKKILSHYNHGKPLQVR